MCASLGGPLNFVLRSERATTLKKKPKLKHPYVKQLSSIELLRYFDPDPAGADDYKMYTRLPAKQSLPQALFGI